MKTRMNRSLILLLAICLAVPLFAVTTLASATDNFRKATAISLDDRPYPAYDYSRANKLPMEMTGYWEKSFTVNNQTRTAKIYISPETPIRSYYTVIAIPDGITTSEFLWRSGWKDLADETEEGLFVLEPGTGGWGSANDELAYVTAAMNFYISNRYFSIFGEHYLVGYGLGGPALEAWAAANPLKVISQVYVNSKGLGADYLNQFSTKKFDGTTAPGYTTVVFPAGFNLIKYNEVVLPTWYIHPDASASDSIAYWKNANDCVPSPVKDRDLGRVYAQADPSGRWMTSYSGPISMVAVLDRPALYWSKKITRDIRDFLTYYSRYENFFAYGNQLVVRADYKALGIEIHTMMVNGYIREYMVYVPDSAKKLWGNDAPVMWVWAGNSQTDKVFLDATQWWKVAQDEGFVLVFPCEQYSNNSISVSHKDNDLFFRQLREVIVRDYDVDPTRFYSTGQSAGSMSSQAFAIALPEYFAAVASTSGTSVPDSKGTVTIDGMSGGTAYPASNQMIPNYMINGGGDMSNFVGTLWDGINNDFDSWAAYFLGVNGLVLGNGVANLTVSGWYDRFNTWTWSKTFGAYTVPLFKVTNDKYRSHNCIYEEMPMLWDFAKHYSCEVDLNNKVTRYYSKSGFKVKGDMVRIYP
jgi:poly(3-hydroxybutyrate) depolymerase